MKNAFINNRVAIGPEKVGWSNCKRRWDLWSMDIVLALFDDGERKCTHDYFEKGISYIN